MNKRRYIKPTTRSLHLFGEGHILTTSELPGGGEGELDAPKKGVFSSSQWLKKNPEEEI